MFRTRVSPWDALAVLAVLCGALLLFFHPWLGMSDGETLLISTPDGNAEYSLAVDREIPLTSNGVTLLVVIENGEAYVKRSDCHDGVCVAGGRIRQGGQTVICAPAGVRLTVKGGDGDVDFVAG